MPKFFFIAVFPILFSCSAQYNVENSTTHREEKIDKIDVYYFNYKNDSIASQSFGTVANGSLKNGCLVPFSGNNFKYFDSSSYLNGRAFTNLLVLKAILMAYKDLETKSTIEYRLMECSNKCGGKMFPHRTHQNGLSVDFMMPLLKEGKPYTELDDIGVDHYLLNFNDDGQLIEDTTISVDFNEIAKHILILESLSKETGVKIKKVIIKIAYKDKLFSTFFGKKLKKSSIYIVKGLSPLIDSLHDDHYHIDFETL